MRYENGELILPVHVPVSTPAAPVPPPQTYCAVNTHNYTGFCQSPNQRARNKRSLGRRTTRRCLPTRSAAPTILERSRRTPWKILWRARRRGWRAQSTARTRQRGPARRWRRSRRSSRLPHRWRACRHTTQYTTFKRAIQLGSTVSSRLATYRECIEIDRTRET